MTRANGAGVPLALRQVATDLESTLQATEQEMQSLALEFQEMARQIGAIVDGAAALVACADSDRVPTALRKVSVLAAAVRAYLQQRLRATEKILETVVAEDALLQQLARLTREQKAMVRETGILRVLTKIEVARLGEAGSGFRYLAQELEDFSESVARSIAELTRRTNARRVTMEGMRRTLAAALPCLRAESTRLEERKATALAAVDATLQHFSALPSRFRESAEEIGGQIDGVVSAVQAQDITRQQTQHVRDALRMLADRWSADAGSESGPASRAEARAGLLIQSCQLASIRETGSAWIARIQACLDAIEHIAFSGIAALGPMVLAQVAQLTAQLEGIERLELACQTQDERVRAAAGDIAELMRLVSEHLQRSKSVRDRLQLLMFNSIVEASHLGARADGILEISTNIKRLSAAWGETTAGSERAMQQIRTLMTNSASSLAAFSEESAVPLRAAQAETRTGLGILREAAECANTHGNAMEVGAATLQGKVAGIRASAARLEACLLRVDDARERLESVRRDREPPEDCAGDRYDAAAVEERFSAGYTTEMERAVLRAALSGAPLPAMQTSLAGNSVELF